MDIEAEDVTKGKELEEFDIQENPLTNKSHEGLSKITTIRVSLTPRQVEEWDDLEDLE